jgi:hypothetical protein
LPASVELFTKGCLETLHEEYIVPNIIKNKSDKKTDHYYVGDPHSRYIIKKIKGRIISYEDIAMYREEYCEDSPLRLRFPLFFSAEQSKGIFEEPRLLENCDCSDLIEETSFVFSEKISGVQLCDLQANDQLEEIYRAIGRNIAILHKNVEDAPMLAAFSYPNLSDRNIFVEVSEFGYTTYLLILDEMQKNEPRETDILKISRHILANARSLLLSDDAPEKENEIGYWLSAARSFLEGYCQCAFNNPSYPVIVGSHFLDFQNEILNAKGNLPVGEKLGEMMDDIFTPFKTQNDPLDNPQHQKIKRLKHGFYL